MHAEHVTPEGEVEELRGQLPGGAPQATPGKVPRALRYPSPGPIRGPSPGPQHLPPLSARPRGLGHGRGGMFPGYGLPGQGIADMLNRQLRQIELLELLALGAEFQFRLAGTVTAAWAGPDRAAERADAVTVTPHEGQGWGTLAAALEARATGSSAGGLMAWTL